MTKQSRQKLKYLENDKSFYDEIKSIFHHFVRAFIEIKQIFLEGERPTLTSFVQPFSRCFFKKGASYIWGRGSKVTSVQSNAFSLKFQKPFSPIRGNKNLSKTPIASP